MKRTYHFEFTRHADRFFGKFPKNVQKRLLKKLDALEKKENPLQWAKKLQGIGERYSFRVGDYRIICAQQKTDQIVILIILTVGHRKDVYE